MIKLVKYSSLKNELRPKAKIDIIELGGVINISFPEKKLKNKSSVKSFGSSYPIIFDVIFDGRILNIEILLGDKKNIFKDMPKFKKIANDELCEVFLKEDKKDFNYLEQFILEKEGVVKKRLFILDRGSLDLSYKIASNVVLYFNNNKYLSGIELSF